MKVKITRGAIASGTAYDVGDEPDLNANDAKLLIRLGKAKPIIKKPEPVAKEPTFNKETEYKTPSGKTVKVNNKRKRGK